MYKKDGSDIFWFDHLLASKDLKNGHCGSSKRSNQNAHINLSNFILLKRNREFSMDQQDVPPYLHTLYRHV